MAGPSVAVTYRDALADSAKLAKYRAESKDLSARHQCFIAELMMLRLFAVMERAVSEIAYKLVAGSAYLNGRVPNRLVAVRSIGRAREEMQTRLRPRPPAQLRWSKASYVCDSTVNVLDQNDPFLEGVRAHGAMLDEMRKVRNVLAHRNATSRRGYRQVVRQTYGANVPIQPGPFLVSDKRLPTPKIDTYLSAVPLMLNDMVSGQ